MNAPAELALVVDVRRPLSGIALVDRRLGIVDQTYAWAPVEVDEARWQAAITAGEAVLAARNHRIHGAKVLIFEHFKELRVAQACKDASGGRLMSRSLANAWGELRDGVGATLGDHAYIGLGRAAGAVVIGGRVSPAALSHVCVDPTGPMCSCGRRGCAAAHTSPAGFRRAITELELGVRDPLSWRGDDGLADLLTKRAVERGCVLSRHVLRLAGDAIGRVIGGVVNSFDLRDVVVHMSDSTWHYVEPHVQASLRLHTFAATRSGLRWHLAQTDDAAAVRAAAAAASRC